MKKIHFGIIFIFFSVNIFSQIVIDFENGHYEVPCKVNGIPMNFIFDTGATSVTISLTEASFLLKQGLLDESDIKQNIKYKIANGEINEGTEIILRKIEIEELVLKDVVATVVHEQNAHLLLGMSALSKIGKITIENNKLIISDFGFKKQIENVDIKKEISETIEWINSKLVENQFISGDTKQIQYFEGVEEVNNQFYLIGTRIQETIEPWGFSEGFFIPIMKINNVEFVEKEYNYWFEIKTKNNESAILIVNDENDKFSKARTYSFIIDKSIDDENLRPRLKKAFEHIMLLYGNNMIEKF